MKKLTAVIFALSTLFLLTACGGNDIPVIGICQYGEHPSLDNCREGFLQGLADAGLQEGVDFEVNYQNAAFNDDLARQIASAFAGDGVDLMCAVATPAATACYAATEDNGIPVIFTAINDPEKSGLTEGEITGTSDRLPVEGQLELIRRLQPEARTIGILYTLSEPNSVSAVETYEQLAPGYGFTIEAMGVTAQAEVTQACDALLKKGVDCLSNLTDNNVVGVLPSIVEKTNAAGVPVYGSEIEQLKKGCVAACGIDYVALGRQTGAMAARVLAGEKASDIPYETIEQSGLYLNEGAAAELGLTVPQALRDAARAVATEQ